jgi:membrane protein DedA with SNARE-associated domain
MAFGIGFQALIELIRQYGILAVMGGAIIEEILVPIPSPIIPMAAGVILIETRQLLPALFQIFFYITLPASFASVLSSYFVYAIAYFGGKPLIDRYGKYFDLEWEELEEFEAYFGHEREKHYVALFRAIPIIPLSMISGAAGLFRMDWKEYGIWSFIGMVPRNFGLAFIGWYVQDEFIRIASQIDTLSTSVMISIGAIVVLVILDRKLGGMYKILLSKH